MVHITAAGNQALIEEGGLKPAHELACDAGVDPTSILLRSERITLPTGAMLNHQRPITQALKAAHHVLEGHTPESWATQLDARVFFWPHAKGLKFAASIARDTPIAVLTVDAGRLYDAVQDHLDLAPANSGNFKQGGAHLRRGDWLYVPAKEAARFPRSRITRGLKTTPDTLREVSLRGALPASTLATLNPRWT